MQQFGFGGKAQKKKPLLKGEKDPTQIHSAELNDIMQYVGVDLEEEARGLVGASDEEDEVEAPLSEEQMREKRWFINVDNVWNRCQGFGMCLVFFFLFNDWFKSLISNNGANA